MKLIEQFEGDSIHGYGIKNAKTRIEKAQAIWRAKREYDRLKSGNRIRVVMMNVSTGEYYEN